MKRAATFLPLIATVAALWLIGGSAANALPIVGLWIALLASSLLALEGLDV